MNNQLLSLYTLPLWLQVYVQLEKNPYIKSLLRKTTKILNNRLLLTIEDKNKAIAQNHIGWYYTIRDFTFIVNDSDEGHSEYNYYYNIYTSSQQFLIKNFPELNIST